MAKSWHNLQKLIRKLQEKPCSVSELATYLGSSERTIYRHLDVLRVDHFGFKFIDTPGSERKYLIEKSETEIPKDLIRNLDKMRESLKAGGNHKFNGLLNTIRKILDPATEENPKGRPVWQLNPHFHIDHGPMAEFSKTDPTVSRLLDAIDQQQVLKLRYASANGVETFSFHPYKLSLRVGRLYLLGVRTDAPKTVINLVCDRIQQIMSTSATFAPVDFDADLFYKYCFGQWIPRNELGLKPEIIELELKSPWTIRLFKEAHFNPAAKVYTQGRRTLCELKLYLTADLENFLLGLTPWIKVLKPSKLNHGIQLRMKEYLGLNEKGSSPVLIHNSEYKLS
jgi:predicted DNA-binding transcriptional regulator YafY